MSIGIITIHRATNYGAVLQAYALKTKLKLMGYDASLIDYRSANIEDFYYKMINNRLSYKTNIKNILTWDIQKKRNRTFTQFIRDYLECNEETSVYVDKNLNEVESKYTSIIAGSDQIWNPFCTGNDKTYFLNFVKDGKKKYSYAASLGNIKKSFLNDSEYKRLLNDFSKISVREKKGQEALCSMLQKDVRIDLDPTFLLKKEQWVKLIPQIERAPYLVVYSLAMPDSIVQFAEKCAAERGLDVVYITLNNLFTKRYKKKKNIITCSPQEFLGYIYNAECVVTNSFHGTAFSIIFNKDFYVEKNANPNHDNSRLENVLMNFGLESRFIQAGQAIESKQIDYEKVNVTLIKQLEKAEEYLKDITG